MQKVHVYVCFERDLWRRNFHIILFMALHGKLFFLGWHASGVFLSGGELVPRGEGYSTPATLPCGS